MKRLLLLFVVLAAAFIGYNRQRLYLRDPLASVQRAGVTAKDTRVFINYSNDILLEDSSGNRHRVYLVQNWNRLPSVPATLKCLTLTACLADADHATGSLIPGAKMAGMTSTRITFEDENEMPMLVILR